MGKTTYSTIQDTSFIPTLGVTIWVGWISFLFNLLLYLAFFATTNQRIVIIAILITSLLLPKNFPGNLGERVGEFSAFQARKYFGLKVTFEDEQAIKNISLAPIFACEPHDILPFNVFAFNPCLNIIPSGVGDSAKGLVTGSVFNIPILRQVYTWNNAVPVDKKTFRYRLKHKQTVVFVPGGVQEVTMLDPKRPQDLVLYLKSRKGFIKLALENGNPIIPVFCFGIDGSYGYWIPGGELMNQIARCIGFVPLIMWGRFGIPLGIPRPTKLHNVIGKPIEIPCEGSDVKDESVEKYHALFLKEMEALFERHKHIEGYGDRTLKIL